MPKSSNKAVLVIASSGRCIWEDLKKAEILVGSEGFDIMGVNDLIMHIPHDLKYGYSNDARLLQIWTAARRRGYLGPESLHSLESRQPLFPPEGWMPHALPVIGHNLKGQGTSPLSACYVGMELGYEEIILCGVPLDESGHYFDPPDIETNRYHQDFFQQERQLKYWKEAIKDFDGRVISMSGHTKELLGDTFNKRTRWNRSIL